jgi:hypothetical protein
MMGEQTLLKLNDPSDFAGFVDYDWHFGIGWKRWKDDVSIVIASTCEFSLATEAAECAIGYTRGC